MSTDLTDLLEPLRKMAEASSKIMFPTTFCPECHSNAFLPVGDDIYACNGCLARYSAKEIGSNFKLDQSGASHQSPNRAGR